MASIANPAPVAVAANGSADPFTASPTHAQPTPVRYGPFNGDQFSLYATNSPASAKRALEAHLKDTDRRIQDASRLGTTLVQQRRDLAARLKEVEQVQSDQEVPAALQQRLSELEKEYNEVGRESARAFLPRTRVVSDGVNDANNSAVASERRAESPSKLAAPTRKQRNQPSNRVHDIEFATEISTSLLAQVRQLQAALAEKDDSLKSVTANNAQLQADVLGMTQRIRHLDENEQKYKDETWNLETRLQELESNYKDSTDKHNRLAQTLVVAQSEKAAKERELDDLKATHERSADDYTTAKKVQEADLQGLRRDAAANEAERLRLNKKVDELTAQNTELAKAVSQRWKSAATASDTDFVSADDGEHSDDMLPEPIDPLSPVKGTPARHGMLESETLKSSLNHAHRMIQNLKNNIHREKTEKIELKRMLQDARDELESKREGGVAANVARRRRAEPEGLRSKKSATRLGAARSATTEVVGEPDWEDQDGELTPSRPSLPANALATAGAATAAYNLGLVRRQTNETDSTDGFETAHERDTTESEAFETATERDAAETDAFATGVEDQDDSDGDATETESNAQRNGTIRGIRNLSGIPADRRSIQSTASTSDEDDTEIIRTPVQNSGPRYRMRGGRVAGRRSGRVDDLRTESPSNRSPASSIGTPQAGDPMQSLGDELDALDEGSIGGTPASARTVESAVTPGSPGTPSRSTGTNIIASTPQLISSPVIVPDSAVKEPGSALIAKAPETPKPTMVDSGVMTEPWEPPVPKAAAVAEALPSERNSSLADAETPEKPTLRDRAGDLVGGALAGFGLSRMVSRRRSARGKEALMQDQANAGATSESVPPLPTEPSFDEEPSTSGLLGASEDSIAEKRSTMIAVNEGQEQPATVGVADPVGSQTEENKSKSRDDALRTLEGNDEVVRPQTAIPIQLGFSSILAQEYEPVSLPEEKPVAPPLIPRRSARRKNTFSSVDGQPMIALPGADPSGYWSGASTPNAERADPFSSPRGVRSAVSTPNTNDRSDPFNSPLAQKPAVIAAASAAAGASAASAVEDRPVTAVAQPTVTNDEPDKAVASESRELPIDDARNSGPLPITKPLVIKKPLVDEGSQTLVSGKEIEAMMRNKSGAIPLKDASNSPMKTAGAGLLGAGLGAGLGASAVRRSFDIADTGSPRANRRPGSGGSIRGKTPATPPPLPADHTQKIAAAGAMGPPSMPASAYKNLRPKTPTERATASRDGTTPRPARHRDSRAQAGGVISSRASVASFASECDDRFDMHRGQIMYPHDIEPATDPRMIQAITQTMIGEYLWKYTRKAGRSEVSNTRHRRFFWVHPYTRTLYWSEQDPSTAGKNMLKAKSVAIDSVRVVSDDNAFPPGLHRKSLVVVTPGREIVFTAPTGQRHETWFNALSYLLLRTSRERDEAEDTITPHDLHSENPGHAGVGSSVRRSFSRITSRSARSRSRVSMSSYNSRATRASSPPGRHSITAAQRARAEQIPTLIATDGMVSHSATPSISGRTSRDMGTAGSRLSTFASRFRSGSSTRGRTSDVALVPQDPAQIYDASVAADSAEDLRAVMAKQESEADRVENVRACCDGKHDVGSLSRRGRHSSLGNRFSSHIHSHHSHAQPRSESRTESRSESRQE